MGQEPLSQYGLLKLKVAAHRQENTRREVEQNLPIIEGSGSVCEMRDLTESLIRILTAKGITEESAKVLIASYTTNAELLDILNANSDTKKS